MRKAVRNPGSSFNYIKLQHEQNKVERITKSREQREAEQDRQYALRQKKKKEKLTHPYLGEKMVWGLIPYVQSLLLSRYLREDLDEYPVFLWK